MVGPGDSREGSYVVRAAAAGEQGPAEQHEDQKWVWLLPGKCGRGRCIVGFRG